MTAADAITTLSAAIAAIAFVCGISAWKREFVGKRRIELAEDVLAKFYEAADAIREVRSPHGSSDEGKSRQRLDNERPEEIRALDRAHVLFERHNKHLELFADLQSLKFRYMATFGKFACEPFKELCSVLNDLRIAANELGMYWWPKEQLGQLTERDAAEMRKCQDIFWSRCRESEDEIAGRVNAAVHKVEEYVQVEVRSQVGWWRRAWQSCRCLQVEWARRAKIVPETETRFTPSPS